MTDIKSWAAAVCAAAIAGSLAHLMSPPGNMQKIYRFVVSTFFICAMLLPLLSAGRGFYGEIASFSAPGETGAGELENKVQEQTAELFAGEIKRLAKERLREMGIASAEISVKIHEEEDGGIYIEQLSVILPPEEEERGGEILWALQSYLGVTPKLIRREETGEQGGQD